jgi:hypothetical protein
VVEGLPNKLKVLNSSPSTTKKGRKEERKKEGTKEGRKRRRKRGNKLDASALCL